MSSDKRLRKLGKQFFDFRTITVRIKTLRTQQSFVKYLKNTSWMFFERIIKIASGLLIGAWIARYLGPERFGLFSYATALVGMLAGIASLGLDNILVKIFVQEKSRAGEILGTAFIVRMIASVITFIIVITVAIAASENQGEWKIILVLATAILFNPFHIIDTFFQSRVLARYVVYATIVTVVVAAFIKVAAISLRSSLETFAVIAVIEAALFSGALFFFYFKKEGFVLSWRIDKNLAWGMLRQGWPLIFSGLVISIYMKIDQVMLQQLLGNASVGQYAAAMKISSAFYFLPMVLAKSFFPAIVEAKMNSEEQYYRSLQQLYSVANWVAIIVALVVTFFGDDIILLLYGDRYREAGSVLYIHIWGLLFIGIQNIGGRWVVAENSQRQALVRATVGMVLNIMLNLFLIEKYGIVGAAVSTVIAYMFVGYLSNLMFRSHFRHFIVITRSFVDIFIWVRR